MLPILITVKFGTRFSCWLLNNFIQKITSVYGVRQKLRFIHGCNSKYRSMRVVRHEVPVSYNQTSGHSVYYLPIALIL